MRRGRRRWRRGRGPALVTVAAALAGALAAAACSLTGLDTDYAADALAAADAGDASPADAAVHSDAAPQDATGEPADATVDAGDVDADADADSGPAIPVCPVIAAGHSVCDDSPRHAIAVIHCAEGGPLYSPDFYFCYSSDDCVHGSLCVDEGFCKPTCTSSKQCADNDAAASYGATSCNPVSLDAGLNDP